MKIRLNDFSCPRNKTLEIRKDMPEDILSKLNIVLKSGVELKYFCILLIRNRSKTIVLEKCIIEDLKVIHLLDTRSNYFSALIMFNKHESKKDSLYFLEKRKGKGNFVLRKKVK